MRGEGKTAYSMTNVLEKMKLIFSCKYGLANLVSFNTEKEHIRVKNDSSFFTVGNVIPMYRTYVNSTNAAFTRGGCGTALSKEKSQVKAFGEFIERFCGSNSFGDHDLQVEYNTYADQKKKGDCLDLFELIDFDDNAYNNHDIEIYRYTHDKVVSWVKGVEITNKRDAWVPAQKAFLGMRLLNGELPHLQWLSTGLACGSSYHRALIGGIYEVVERDSFMLTWQLRLHGTRIVIDQIKNPSLEKLYTHINNYIVGDDKLFIYDISR